MSPKTRRSKSAKADRNDDHASNNSPKNVPRTSRRSSSANDTPRNTKLNRYSSMLENVFEDPIDTPEKKKKETTSNSKLNDNKISKILLSSDEELYTGKPWKSQLISDENSIKMKFTSKESECNIIIGARERTKISSKLNETPKKLRRTMGEINYNEDAMMEKHEMEVRDLINSATPKRNHKNNKSQTTNQVVESRKRTKENTQLLELQENDVDENEAYQASQISSPPKRSKSEIDIEQTPKKDSQPKKSQPTPRSAAKRKLLTDVPSNTRMSTRRSTRCNSAGIYAENSSSDENARKSGNEKVVQKLDVKKSTKQSSKNTRTSESGESETENNMSNANKNSTTRNTRSRSKSIQEPAKSFEKSIYSPTKDMQKLNISEGVGTPTRSGRDKSILKVPRSLMSTSSNTPNTNTEKPYNTRTMSRPQNYCINDSEDENADSSNDFNGKGESSESEESLESGNDSAEEFQKLSRRKKNVRSKGKVPATPKTPKRVTQVSMDTPTKVDKHRRTSSICKPSTPLQKARATLHVSVLPKSLPCREEQFNDIYSFLHARLSDGSGGCIYISGVPGTGKTATVSEVIHCLKRSMTKGELSDFDYIDINGMKLSEPRQAYVQIWKQMSGDTKTWEESHRLLHNKFTNSNSKRKMTLLLVDELDLLCTKRQDVVYNLLDWPSKTNAKLVVVTIANTMDLPERILMGKVTSRLGLTRLTFPPYNFKQLEEIVVSRLKGANAFGGETVELVARKVAAVSGDARRALDICRRSAEIAENNGRQQVSMIDVKQALDEMIASPKIQAIRHCSDMEKYFLQAVCTEVQRTGVEEVVFKNVYMQMETLCSLDGLKVPNVSEALEICARLGSWRLLLCDHSRMDIHQRLLLNVSTDDVYFATKEINA